MEITLKYNPRNKSASRIIDIILAMDGVFKVKEHPGIGSDVTRRAMQEAESGDVVTCESYEDYLKQTGINA